MLTEYYKCSQQINCQSGFDWSHFQGHSS